MALPGVVALAVWFCAMSGPAQSQSRPLPQPDAFYAEVRNNLARADREQFRYAYRERRSEVHTNPFGKIGTGGILVYDVVPGKELGIYHRKLVERDGEALSEQKLEVIDRRSSQGKPNPSIEDVVDTLAFKIRGRETINGREYILVDFEPKPNARPKTRQGRIAKVFKGTVWIDEAEHEVMRVEATSMDSLSYGGFVARLDEGTRATLLRERVDSSVWLPTSIKLKGAGRALLIRKLNVDYIIEWFNYRKTLN